MNLGGIRSLVEIYLRDLDNYNYSPGIIDTFINEGLRVLAAETLLLEGKDSSLTYDSTNDGFTVPTDFIKVKDLLWVDSSSGQHSVPQKSLEQLYKMRNDWLGINESAGSFLAPLGFALNNETIILDSTTQTSPTLYYYKYDTALSGDTSSPSIDSEFHSALADYAFYKITRDTKSLAMWRDGISKMSASKFKQARTARARYIGI